MPQTVQQILSDPLFRALDPADQHSVLNYIDPAYAGLPGEDQQSVLQNLHFVDGKQDKDKNRIEIEPVPGEPGIIDKTQKEQPKPRYQLPVDRLGKPAPTQQAGGASIGAILLAKGRAAALAAVNALGQDPVSKFFGEAQKAMESTPAGANISAGVKQTLANPASLYGAGAVGMVEEPSLLQGGHAGGGVASVEELARPGRFVKISRSGMSTDQGKTPDFTLKNGEAGYQVKPDGSYELKDGQESPAVLLGLKRYIQEVFGAKSSR